MALVHVSTTPASTSKSTLKPFIVTTCAVVPEYIDITSGSLQLCRTSSNLVLEMQLNAFEKSMNVVTKLHSFLTVHSSIICRRARMCWMINLCSWNYDWAAVEVWHVAEYDWAISHCTAWQQVTWVQCLDSFHTLKHLLLEDGNNARNLPFLRHYSCLKHLIQYRQQCLVYASEHKQIRWNRVPQVLPVFNSEAAVTISSSEMEPSSTGSTPSCSCSTGRATSGGPGISLHQLSFVLSQWGMLYT